MYKFTGLAVVVVIAAFSLGVEGSNSTLLQARGGDEDGCEKDSSGLVVLGNECCEKGACCVNTGLLSGNQIVYLICSPVQNNGICTGGSACSNGDVCTQLFNIGLVNVLTNVSPSSTQCCPKDDPTCGGLCPKPKIGDTALSKGGSSPVSTKTVCCSSNQCTSNN